MRNLPASSLQDILRRDADDAVTFGEFIDAWNFYFSENSALDYELEKLTESFLNNVAHPEIETVAGPQIRRMLSSFPNPALLVGAGGVVISCNVKAIDSFGLDIGSFIDDLPYALEGGNAISDEISHLSKSSGNVTSVRFLNAYSHQDDHTVKLAVLLGQPGGPGQSALVFVIDPRFMGEMVMIFTEGYGLSTAEADVLNSFIRGASLDQISQERGTSLTTVRTQFQNIMTKAGVSSQAELVRNALALAQFQADLQDVADVAAHPYRKKSSMLRPKGRTVEVMLCGDLTGDLVVVLPDTTQFGFPAVVEAEFARAGLCVATLCRPGVGGSDPVPRDEHVDTIADDLIAFLAHYEKRTCVLVGSATTCCYSYRLGGMIPDYIRKIVLLRPLPPGGNMLGEMEMQSAMPSALRHGYVRAPKLMDFFARAALRSWRVAGVRNFTKRSLRDFQPDVDIALRPDVIKEFDTAYKAMVAQGYDVALFDLSNIFLDWSDWVHQCKTPVVWFQGDSDPVARPKDFDAYASRFATSHELVLLKDAGYMAYFSRIEEFIAALKA